MKLKIQYIIILIGLIGSGCSSYESAYQSTPLTIDGSSSDWKATLDTKKSQDISYGVSNDSENLYLRLHIIDQAIQMKILTAGLTIWIDTTAKSKKELGINCPLQKAPPKMDKNSMVSMQDKPKWNKNQLLEAEFIGFEEADQVYFISNNPFGVEISMDQDEFRAMYYELKVPFSSINLNTDNIISIGLETGSIDLPGTENMQTGMRPSGGMGGKSGGMGGGRPVAMGGKPGKMNSQRPNMETMDNLKTPTKFWIKNIQLANN